MFASYFQFYVVVVCTTQILNIEGRVNLNLQLSQPLFYEVCISFLPSTGGEIAIFKKQT
jgi:hypothetical protein